MGRRTLVTAHVLLLTASLTGAVLTTRASDWEPVTLVVLLAALSLISEAVVVETRGLRLSGAIAMVYREVGLAALVGFVGVLFLFQVLTRELLLSQERSEMLEARSTQLASLQVGVLSAMLQTLSLRDRMTARHSAAVARY